MLLIQPYMYNLSARSMETSNIVFNLESNIGLYFLFTILQKLDWQSKALVINHIHILNIELELAWNSG